MLSQEKNEAGSDILGVHDIQDRGRISRLRKYRAVMTGDKGWGFLLKFELLQVLVLNMPGAIGIAARQQLYRGLFGRIGRNVVIGRGVCLRRPSDIVLEDSVILDDYSRVTVLGGEPSAISFGEGAFLGPYSICTSRDAAIHIGAHSSVSSHCRIGLNRGTLEIGRCVMVAAFCYLGGGQHSTTDPTQPMMFQDMVQKGDLVIEDDVWIGAHSFVMPGIRVGRGAVIGACSLVKDDIPAYAIAYGRPAKVQGNRG